MPIYAYKCDTCGHAADVMRKISDPPLTACPQCHAETFVKQLTAPGFALKGSGWYVTDFRNNGAKDSAKDSTTATAANVAEKSSTEKSTSSEAATTASSTTDSTSTPASTSTSNTTSTKTSATSSTSAA